MRKNGLASDFKNRLVLKLYVTGMSPQSMAAINNLRQLCMEHLNKDSYDLEIIDLYKNPEVASDQQIIFSPSLIRQRPLPKKILVGNFSDKDKVLRALGIIPNE